MKSDIEEFCPANQQEWRTWLNQFHKDKEGVWLIIYKKSAALTNLSWSEAVDEALCFGWIDSLKKTVDADKYKQYFCKRKKKSVWSKVNKLKIEQLTKDGLMREAGFKSVEIAKQNGSWSMLDSAENLQIPADLEEKLHDYPDAKSYFSGLSNSARKSMLFWVAMAKQPQTRLKRINEIVENAKLQRKPKHFTPVK